MAQIGLNGQDLVIAMHMPEADGGYPVIGPHIQEQSVPVVDQMGETIITFIMGQQKRDVLEQSAPDKTRVRVVTQQPGHHRMHAPPADDDLPY